MYYYIGPWQISDQQYTPPNDCVGVLDLRSITDQSNLDGNGYGLFVTKKELDSSYTLLCAEDFRFSRCTTRHQNIFESLFGYRPDGDMVADLLFDYMVNGTDPHGLEGPKPILPRNGNLELAIGGHPNNVVKRKKLTRDSLAYNKIRDVIREDYRIVRARNNGNHTKLLSILGKEYGIENPENEFIPRDLPKEKPTRPSTTYTETFPSNGTTLITGQDLTWDGNEGQVISNQWNHVDEDITTRLVASGNELASPNLWTQIDIIALDYPSSGSDQLASHVACIARYYHNGNYFFYELEVLTKRNGTKTYTFWKTVGEIRTELFTDTFSGTLTGNKRLEVIGGQLYFYDQTNNLIKNITDTSITTGGCGGFISSADINFVLGDIILDNIIISDENFYSVYPLGVNKYLPLKGHENKYDVWRVT